MAVSVHTIQPTNVCKMYLSRVLHYWHVSVAMTIIMVTYKITIIKIIKYYECLFPIMSVFSLLWVSVPYCECVFPIMSLFPIMSACSLLWVSFPCYECPFPVMSVRSLLWVSVPYCECLFPGRMLTITSLLFQWCCSLCCRCFFDWLRIIYFGQKLCRFMKETKNQKASGLLRRSPA